MSNSGIQTSARRNHYHNPYLSNVRAFLFSALSYERLTSSVPLLAAKLSSFKLSHISQDTLYSVASDLCTRAARWHSGAVRLSRAPPSPSGLSVCCVSFSLKCRSSRRGESVFERVASIPESARHLLRRFARAPGC